MIKYNLIRGGGCYYPLPAGLDLPEGHYVEKEGISIENFTSEVESCIDGKVQMVIDAIDGEIVE